MPTANSFSELENQMLMQLYSAMQKAQAKAKDDLKEGTDYFYSKKPVRGGYQRTYAFERAAKVSQIKMGNMGYSIDAYFEQTHQYTTGDNPTMMKVLPLLEYGKNPDWVITSQTGETYPPRPAAGRKGFWKKTKKKIIADFKREIKSAFR